MSNLDSVKYRRGTSFSAVFPTLPSLTSQPRRVDLYQKQGSHDILVMEFSADSPLWFNNIKTGVPVKFSWTQDVLTREWIGYVSSISKINAPQRQNSMEIMCVAGTFPMKESDARIFENMTIPKIVETIAKEFGFNVMIDEHPQVFSQVVMAGVSYWEFIQEQARRIGYGVVVNNMDFLFKPLDKLINLGFASAPILSMGSQAPAFNTQYLDRTLDYFKVISGENVENGREGRYLKVVGGVGRTNGKAFTAIASPAEVGINLRSDVSDVLFKEYRTERVVDSETIVQQAAQDAAQLGRFNIPATAQCQGDPRIRPYGTVYIDGTGDLSDGFWVVKEAQHMFHKVGDYQMNLVVATDGMGESAQSQFRSRSKNLSGTVNLVEADYRTLQIFIGGDANVRLITNRLQNNEANQGFRRSPTMWAAR